MSDFLVADQVIQLGYAPNRIGILSTLPGIEYKDCYENRILVEIDEVTVAFIDLANLRKIKKSIGSTPGFG